jgi:hypothetical protein
VGGGQEGKTNLYYTKLEVFEQELLKGETAAFGCFRQCHTSEANPHHVHLAQGGDDSANAYDQY